MIVISHLPLMLLQPFNFSLFGFFYGITIHDLFILIIILFKIFHF